MNGQGILCGRKSSYSFLPILSKFHWCFGHGLKICMWFAYNPQIIFYIYNLSLFIPFPAYFALQCYQYFINVYIISITFECKCSYSFMQFFMKHLHVLMSWLEDMDMLWIKFINSVSVFCSANLSCSLIVHIFKLQRQT